MPKNKYDYIIIGGGASGSLVAYSLANKCPETSILLVEMGDNNNDLEIVCDARMMKCALTNPDVAEKKTVSNDCTIHNIPKDITQGRGLGGSSCCSYMMAMKPSLQYLCVMEKCFGMRENVSLEIMDLLEKYVPASETCETTEYRGDCGATTVTQLPTGLTTFNLSTVGCEKSPPPPAVANDYADENSLMRLLSGALNAQYKTHSDDDYNQYPIDENFAVNRVQAFLESDCCGNLIRQQTGSSYLNECQVSNLKNFKIMKCSKVTKINMKEDKHHCDCCNQSKIYRPKSVDLYIKGRCYKMYAKEGVVLAAGYLSTPTILQASGIGPASVMCSLCIDPLIENDNVGANLQLQTGFYIDYWIKSQTEGSSAAKTESAVSLLMAALDPYFRTEQNSCFATVRSSVIYSEPLGAINVSNGPCSSSGQGYYGVRINVLNVLPKNKCNGGEGTVCIVSKDGFTQPFIDAKAYTSDSSKSEVISYYKKIAEEVSTYISEYNLSHPSDQLDLLFPDGDPSGYDEVQVYAIIARNTVKKFGCGTTRVGKNCWDSVVDTNFRVHGTCGLYVSDMSVLPALPDSLPQWYAMTVGYYFGSLLGDVVLKESCKHLRNHHCKNERLCDCRRCCTSAKREKKCKVDKDICDDYFIGEMLKHIVKDSKEDF